MPDSHRPESAREFRTDQLERAIGVIYRPETERISHYFMALINSMLSFTSMRARQ